jgi:hypothetical protein
MAIILGSLQQARAAVVIQNLQVEYRKTPLGIDAVQPRFSWQMAATAAERGDFWREALDREVLALLRAGKEREAEEKITNAASRFGTQS